MQMSTKDSELELRGYFVTAKKAVDVVESRTALEPVSENLNPTHMSMADIDALFANPAQHASAVFDEGPLEREKLRLCGVPLIVTRLNYHSDLKFPKGYVTFHGYVGPREWLEEAVARGWIKDAATVSDMLFRPGEPIKFNDGSTGVRRQATMMLHNSGVINVGDVTSNADFDRSWDEWESFSQSSQENGKNGEKIDVPDITLDAKGNPLRILARHGLRASWMEEWQTNVFYFN